MNSNVPNKSKHFSWVLAAIAIGLTIVAVAGYVFYPRYQARQWEEKLLVTANIYEAHALIAEMILAENPHADAVLARHETFSVSNPLRIRWSNRRLGSISGWHVNIQRLAKKLCVPKRNSGWQRRWPVCRRLSAQQLNYIIYKAGRWNVLANIWIAQKEPLLL